MGSSQDGKGSFPLQSPGQGWALQCLGQLSAPEHVQRQEDRRDRGPDHSLCGDESEKLTRGKQQPNSSRTEGSPAGRNNVLHLRQTEVNLLFFGKGFSSPLNLALSEAPTYFLKFFRLLEDSLYSQEEFFLKKALLKL